MHRLLPLVGLGFAGVACAQDTRKVEEPRVPPACAVLVSNKTGPVAHPDDTALIQRAIDACPAGQAVHLAASNEYDAFVAGPLQLRGGVTLVVDGGATLYASTDPSAYDRGRGTCGKTASTGHGCKTFITVDGGQGGGLMGDGVIDGQGGARVDGRSESWWQIARRAQKEHSEHNVPRLIEVNRARDFALYRITLRNSPNFHVTLNNVDGFTAWSVRLDTPATARNTDGIDPVSSRNITITRSHIRVGDDNVAIKANNSGPSEYISVVDNHFYSGHGMSIGSETMGGVRHVRVENLSMDGTTSGLRIKSDVSRGGLVEDISYRNICLRDVHAPIDISTHYTRGATGELVPVFRGLSFEDVRNVSGGQVIVLGHDADRPVQARFANVQFDQAPQLQLEHAQISPADIFSRPAAAPISCEQRFPAFPQTVVRTSRPQLTPEQARHYTRAEVLGHAGPIGHEKPDPWDPQPLAPTRADYIVDPASATALPTVQAAVNRALADIRASHDPRRRFILVKPGVYRELVYVPAAPAPITLYGEANDATRTVITAGLDAAVTGAAYAAQYGAQFADADPDVKAMFEAARARATLGTFNTATLWTRNAGFQALNLTIENGYRRPPAAPCVEDCRAAQATPVSHQAVALMVDGADRAQFENLRLLGLQDTLYMKAQEGRRTARNHFRRVYIEGDVDFIFGDATAFFEDCEIKSLGDRDISYVGAPDTPIAARYGLVFDRCRFTHDGSPKALAGKFRLARQWFHNQRCTPFGAMAVPGYSCTLADADGYAPPRGTISRSVLETVGKMVVMHSSIGRHIERSHPWADWNQSGKLSFRPVQFDTDDFWAHLRSIGIDPVKAWGYAPQPQTAEPFLAEFENIDE
ncbi:pectinesterase family protein [Roseateles sp. BYS78W]|uniref:Pectinesterase family protein n=1 Tax=Pelomonas candidula TaxID=3299025 RepID=A0ABW7HH83_9BURK